LPRGPRQAENQQGDRQGREPRVVEHEPQGGGYKADAEDEEIGTPELDCGDRDGRPTECAPNEEQNCSKSDGAGQALLASLAGKPDRRVLDDAVAEEKRERESSRHEQDENGARPQRGPEQGWGKKGTGQRMARHRERLIG